MSELAGWSCCEHCEHDENSEDDLYHALPCHDCQEGQQINV